MKRRRERGQAIFETALFVPLFLLSLYGIFVIVTEGSMAERVQLGVRNGGSIFAPGNPYLAYSSYNMYSSIDGVDPADPNGNCNGALPDTTLLYASRTTFWKPAPSASAPAQSCSYSKAVVPINGTYYPLQSDYLSLSAQTGVSTYLVGRVIPTSLLTTQASQNYLRPGTIGELLEISSVGAAVKASLEATTIANQVPVTTCTSETNCPGSIGQVNPLPTPSVYPSKPPTTTVLPTRGGTPTPTSVPPYSTPGA